MKILLIIAAYVLHFVLAYLVQRQILKISKNPEYHPVTFMLFLCFVPFVGLVSSIVVLFIELVSQWSKWTYDYKKFYKIKR